jgi:putative endonuclease
MKSLYVYILKCNDDSYYTGVTNDLDRRIIEHNTGLVPGCYTWKRRPLELVWADCFSPNQAIAIEKQIKGWARKKKEALIQGNWDVIQALSICRNESTSKRLWKEDWSPKAERIRERRTANRHRQAERESKPGISAVIGINRE